MIHKYSGILSFAFLLLLWTASSSSALARQADTPAEPTIESRFVDSPRQVTFEGLRAGEGYFSADGNSMVFQSERVDGNPFFQIFVLDFETGDIEQVSPGFGKTTCAWIHPEGNKVLYSSTQEDPQAREKMLEEIRMREEGTERRYAWDYDTTYEIFEFDRKDKTYRQLTDAEGYDAEGSWSPDGSLVAFASNRNAYNGNMTEEQAKEFEIDPAFMMDIFIMNADGTNVRQLTDVNGYDGGPFFSPDGQRICWRRFSENGATAEIMTMNIDGTDQRQLTKMNALSWAPFYHPSGKYLIYTTNKHGFNNFELYLVDVEGKSLPVRVTDTDGFDGLASFTPDGTQLTWTSNRNAQNQSQIYMAGWNHEAAMTALGEAIPEPEVTAASEEGRGAVNNTSADFEQEDIGRHVDYLCRRELGGRMTGTRGERQATAYVAAYMDSLGLVPDGDDGDWFQQFEFPAGAELGPANSLSASGLVVPERELPRSEGGGTQDLMTVGEDWTPLIFSANTELEAGVAFAGYGIVAPEKDGQPEYNSYEGMDVEGKWALVFRFVPEDVDSERRSQLQFYGELRKKAFHARSNGAAGLIIVSGPTSNVNRQLVPMQTDFAESGSSIPVISITDELAEKMFAANGIDLAEAQQRFDAGEYTPGFDLGEVVIRCSTEVNQIKGTGRNVIGRLMAGDEPSANAILVGAHIDHLGTGTGGSLARNEERGQVHVGADDNASGVAGMLEIAEYLARQKRDGRINLKRDIIFAAWSGEELGLFGSKHFVQSLETELVEAAEASGAQQPNLTEYVVVVASDGTLSVDGQAQTLEKTKEIFGYIAGSHPEFTVIVEAGEGADPEKVNELVEVAKEIGVQKTATRVSGAAVPTGIYPTICAALNMDMIGRMSDKLVLQGVSSSSYWNGTIERRNAVVGLPVTLSVDVDLPTDAASFYRAGVPILSAFTGSHTDYHTPRDTPEKLNYVDATRIARLMGLITRGLATQDEVPDYIKVETETQAVRGGLRAYLGSIPSYGEDVVGVLLSDVTSGAPMDEAGVRGGDIIVELDGNTIENIYDYTAVIDGLKIGEETTITVMRGDERVQLSITPASRK
ncbi:MAG: M20/M25/M40 family metallo-hydrolase [Planctomycetota bacterium]